jgi:RimJ/RimL family protein N-acetyltransferase
MEMDRSVPHVALREVEADDVATFYQHQRDPIAVEMAAFKSRDESAHSAHWRKIFLDETAIVRTIVVDGEVTGNVVSWLSGEMRVVGYWIGREFWGKGIATRALELFLREITQRPLYAYVATHNKGSIRVLEKCGFVPAATQIGSDSSDDVEDLLMELH